MNMPGFDAALSLGPAVGAYRGRAVSANSRSAGSGVLPQLRFQSDPDLGAYLRCKEAGGGELVCRFFGGLPPWTIGGVLF